jgi:hypothetical protein
MELSFRVSVFRATQIFIEGKDNKIINRKAAYFVFCSVPEIASKDNLLSLRLIKLNVLWQIKNT